MIVDPSKFKTDLKKKFHLPPSELPVNQHQPVSPPWLNGQCCLMVTQKEEGEQIFKDPFCVHYGLLLQKSALPTLLKFVRVRAVHQAHVHDTCLFALSKVPIKLMCPGPKAQIWWLTQGRRGQFEFWVQGENKSIGTQIFSIFYQFSWQNITYFTTY